MRSITHARVIPVGATGPEDVVVDADGFIYVGCEDGSIVRLVNPGVCAADSSSYADVIARVPGRPLGLEILNDKELLVCASEGGLLAVEIATGAHRVLATTAPSGPLKACNNAAVHSDGTIYFSDSSTVFPIPRFREDMIERTASGRLLKLSTDGVVTELMNGLEFANGVALALDESFLIVAETNTCTVHRYWLTGPEAGSHEVFASGLSGYPDNASTGSDGTFWVAIPAPEVAVLPKIQKLPKWLRAIVRKLPEWAGPKPSKVVSVVGLDRDGTVVHETAGLVEGFHMLTGVREHNGTLYLSSLRSPAIAVIDAWSGSLL